MRRVALRVWVSHLHCALGGGARAEESGWDYTLFKVKE